MPPLSTLSRRYLLSSHNILLRAEYQSSKSFHSLPQNMIELIRTIPHSWYQLLFLFASILLDRVLTKSNMKKERVCLTLPCHRLSLEGSRAEARGRNLEAGSKAEESQRNPAYRLGFLYQSRNCPTDMTTGQSHEGKILVVTLSVK